MCTSIAVIGTTAQEAQTPKLQYRDQQAQSLPRLRCQAQLDSILPIELASHLLCLLRNESKFQMSTQSKTGGIQRFKSTIYLLMVSSTTRAFSSTRGLTMNF